MNIALFTCGDSTLLSTWSNVPCLFAKTLEEKGHKVYRVDISPNKFLTHWFNSISFRVYRKVLRRNSCPIFQRTIIHRLIINHRIKVANKQYPGIDVNLFLSYSFINKYSDKPNVLWCDWSDAIVIQRQQRKPEWYERKAIKEEAKSIKGADAVFSMFSVCAKQMTKMYDREVIHLNRNVVNTVYDKPWNIVDVISERTKSRRLLFIGNYLYKAGLMKLLDSFLVLKTRYPDLQLHVIGMTQKQVPVIEGVTCYGYLHKDNVTEKDLYYRLLLSSRCIINPTPQWAGYSSTIEAMYYGCPIIVTPYDDFVEEFGSNISFGFYCDNNNLTSCIEKIIVSENYVQLCREAHNQVAHYTWSEYVDSFLQFLSPLLMNGQQRAITN